jgi:hypothetical protein
MELLKKAILQKLLTKAKSHPRPAGLSPVKSTQMPQNRQTQLLGIKAPQKPHNEHTRKLLQDAVNARIQAKIKAQRAAETFSKPKVRQAA